MDGLARSSGKLFREISVGGKTYRLATPRLADLAALEAELLARLQDPLEQAAKAAVHLPPDAHKTLWEAAFAASQSGRRFDVADIDTLPMTLRAAASAFLTLRRNHADEIGTLADALAWLELAADEHGLTNVAAITTAASQETPPKKSPEAGGE